jgi:hypothetical protein
MMRHVARLAQLVRGAIVADQVPPAMTVMGQSRQDGIQPSRLRERRRKSFLVLFSLVSGQDEMILA